MAVEYDGGVVIGADSRTTTGYDSCILYSAPSRLPYDTICITMCLCDTSYIHVHYFTIQVFCVFGFQCLYSQQSDRQTDQNHRQDLLLSVRVSCRYTGRGRHCQLPSQLSEVSAATVLLVINVESSDRIKF